MATTTNGHHPPTAAVPLAPLVHERQKLQLCAVHAVNNLLQLPPSEHQQPQHHVDYAAADAEAPCSDEDEDDGPNGADLAESSQGNCSSHHPPSSRYMCNGALIRRTPQQMVPATKHEFDIIADRMTVMENRLMSEAEYEGYAGDDGGGDARVEDGDGACDVEAETDVDAGADAEDEDEAAAYRRTAMMRGCLSPRSRPTVAAPASAAETNHAASNQGAAATAKAANTAKAGADRPTLTERWWSNHRTMLFGNYSFEAMEIALRKRGVELNWFTVPPKKNNVEEGVSETGASNAERDERDDEKKDDGEQKAARTEEADASSSSCFAQLQQQQRTVVVGFIVNAVEEGEDGSPFNLWGMPERLLRRVPLIGPFFEGGRHWFAVTRLRRIVLESGGVSDSVSYGGGNECMPSECAAHGGAGAAASGADLDVAEAEGQENGDSDAGGGGSGDRWYIIDSDRADVPTLSSDSDLMEYLRGVQDGGGQVFRATMKTVA